MSIRLVIFILSLLLLPVAGLWLSGSAWGDLELRGLTGDAAIVNPPSTLLTTLMMVGYIIFINHLHKLVTGNQPYKGQSDYLLRVAGASAVLGWLLAYLNLYVASWTTHTGNPLLQALLYTPLFATLAPAVLYTQAFVAALPGVSERLGSLSRLMPPAPDKLAYALFTLAVLGLAGGAAWPTQLYALLWFAPLLLLLALQLLWHESTILSGLKRATMAGCSAPDWRDSTSATSYCLPTKATGDCSPSRPRCSNHWVCCCSACCACNLPMCWRNIDSEKNTAMSLATKKVSYNRGCKTQTISRNPD